MNTNTVNWAVPLPLFPLQTVLFPGGLLMLKVFEARYLDLMSRCMRSPSPFGVVCINRGNEAGPQSERMKIESVGVLAHLLEVDAPQTGILHIRCKGVERFRLLGPPSQASDGLWSGLAEAVEPDNDVVPDTRYRDCVQALAQALERLRQEGTEAVDEPLRLDDASWVANRWCELLPISLAAKQRLMELEDPEVRLRLVDEFLRQRQVI